MGPNTASHQIGSTCTVSCKIGNLPHIYMYIITVCHKRKKNCGKTICGLVPEGPEINFRWN